MKPYLLLTPGPLTTSETVKETMMTGVHGMKTIICTLSKHCVKSWSALLPAIRKSIHLFFCKEAEPIV